MADGDASIANKVLETVGLPLLPADEAVRGSVSADTASQHLAEISGLDDSFTDVNGTGDQPGSHDTLSSDLASGMDQTLQTHSDETMWFNDLYQMNWDDIVSPDWPWMTLFPTEYDMAPNGEPVAGTTRPTPNLLSKTITAAGANVLGNGESSNDDEADQELVGQIAARFGSLHVAPDGKLRYFGTPTNLHLFSSNKYNAQISNPRSMKVDGARLLRNADLEQNIDTEVESHLIELYFSWHNSCHPVIDKSMYWNMRKQSNNSFENNGCYSEVLTNAM